jgi:hypothetical protein
MVRFDMGWRRTVASGVIAIVLFVVLLLGVGWKRVLTEVGNADPTFVVLALVTAVVALVARSMTVLLLLSTVEEGWRPGRVVTIYAFGTFLRNVLPWGRTAGSALTAYLFARESRSDFEPSFAVLVVAETLSLLASLVVMAIGGTFLIATRALPVRGGLTAVLVSMAGLVVGVAFFLVIRPAWTLALAARLFEATWRAVAVIPFRGGGRLTRTGLHERVDRFRVTMATVGADAETVASGYLYAQAGWIATILPLQWSLLALGADPPVAVAMVVVPVGATAAIVPLPGGLGSIDFAIGALLVALTDLSLAVVAATVVVYRLCSFWFPLTIGGLAGVYLNSVEPTTAHAD